MIRKGFLDLVGSFGGSGLAVGLFACHVLDVRSNICRVGLGRVGRCIQAGLIGCDVIGDIAGSVLARDSPSVVYQVRWYVRVGPWLVLADSFTFSPECYFL